MSFPKPDEESKAYFESLVPDDPRVQSRPMFGNRAAFVNGQMFLALFGSQVAVRLSDPDRVELLKQPGTSDFEPMPGRPMKEYVVLPEAWRKSRRKAALWVSRSLDWASGLPPKMSKKKPTRRSPKKNELRPP
jgi:TfoX/Sxy family transcriptional regulator of competence genes